MAILATTWPSMIISTVSVSSRIMGTVDGPESTSSCRSLMLTIE